MFQYDREKRAASTPDHQDADPQTPGRVTAHDGFGDSAGASWEDIADDQSAQESVQLGHIARSSDLDSDEARAAASGPATEGEEASQVDQSLQPNEESGGQPQASASVRATGTGTGAASGGPSKWETEVSKRRRERKVKSGKRHWAKRDRYNSKHVKHNEVARKGKLRKHQIARAGVRFQGKDKFDVNVPVAPRYQLLADGVTVKQVRSVNHSQIHRKGRGKEARLALNPTHTLDLMIEGKLEECVLTWHGGNGAAWLPVKYLMVKGDKKSSKKKQAQIVAEVNRQSGRKKPKRANMAGAAHFKFGGRHAAASDKDQHSYVLPKQNGKPDGRRGPNSVADYLQTRRGNYNLLLNLPSHRTAPVASDIVDSDGHFFVAKGDRFVREIAVYAPKSNTSKKRQTWVYGCVGKLVGTEWKPDEKRRGWVPLRVLTPAW